MKRTHYITVPAAGGPYWLGDILSSPPGALTPAELTIHEQETLAACFTINGNELTLEAITNTNNLVRDTIHIVKGPEYDPADFNHDGWVDVKDLAEIVSQWLDDGMWP